MIMRYGRPTYRKYGSYRIWLHYTKLNSVLFFSVRHAHLCLLRPAVRDHELRRQAGAAQRAASPVSTHWTRVQHQQGAG